MEINHLSIHRLTLADGTIELIPNPNTGRSEFERYLNGLITDVANDIKGKKFKIRALNTQVISIAQENSIAKKYDGQLDICRRLMDKEIAAQKEIQRMGTVLQSGIIIQACITHAAKRKYVICKADNATFINERTYKRDTGYAEKRKVFKSFIITYNDDDLISEICINDSNSIPSRYWWDDFLEVDKYHDDAYNTSTAFNGVDKILDSIKKKFPADHTYLRNSTIGLFRSTEHLAFDEFIDKSYANYVPVDSTFPLDDVVKRLKELPAKYNFDNKFTVDRSEITARLKNVIPLTNNLDLVIKQDIDIDNTIVAVIENHIKFIKIKTDIGYNAFKKNEEQ